MVVPSVPVAIEDGGIHDDLRSRARGGEASLPQRWVAEEATGLDGGCVEPPTSDAPPDNGLTIATLLAGSSLALARAAPRCTRRASGVPASLPARKPSVRRCERTTDAAPTARRHANETTTDTDPMEGPTAPRAYRPIGARP
jgi:hypothetical protein